MSAQPLPAPFPLRMSVRAPHLHDVKRVPKHTSSIPDPAPHFVRALAAHAFEVIEGKRAIAQLGAAITFSAARQLAEQRQAVSERQSAYRDPRTCAASPGPLHLCRVLPHLAEASVAVHTGRRSHAVSLRLEWIHGRWKASEIYVL